MSGRTPAVARSERSKQPKRSKRSKQTTDAAQLERAMRLSRLPGVTLAEACRRTGVPMAALRRARKERAWSPSRDDLILAALTRNGEVGEGEVGDLRALAAWIDYVNHDGSTAAEVAADLARMAAAGRLVLDRGDVADVVGGLVTRRFRLVGPWP